MLQKYFKMYIACITFSGLTLYNIFSDNDPEMSRYTEFLDLLDVRAAIHVGHITFPEGGFNYSVQAMLDGEFLTSARPLYEELLNHYRVLAYW